MDNLQKPTDRKSDLSLAGFKLWIHKYESPNSDDFWDGNWLDVTALCVAQQSSVLTEGVILHLGYLHTFYTQAKQLYNSLSGSAYLESPEPNLDLTLTMESKGQCKLKISITPDNLNQEHTFIFSIDQSYLPPVISQLESIFNSYPLKGSQQ